MQQISAPEAIVQAMVQTIGNSPILSLFLLLLAVLGFCAFAQHLNRPRFDPRLYMARPPIDHQPQRPLPSADEFANWATGNQREKQPAHRGIPWDQ